MKIEISNISVPNFYFYFCHVFKDFSTFEVEDLKPDVLIDNLLFLARCLISKNDKKRAMMYLTRASHLTPKNEAENQVLKEVNDLLTRYKLNC